MNHKSLKGNHFSWLFWLKMVIFLQYICVAVLPPFFKVTPRYFLWKFVWKLKKFIKKPERPDYHWLNLFFFFFYLLCRACKIYTYSPLEYHFTSCSLIIFKIQFLFKTQVPECQVHISAYHIPRWTNQLRQNLSCTGAISDSRVRGVLRSFENACHWGVQEIKWAGKVWIIRISNAVLIYKEKVSSEKTKEDNRRYLADKLILTFVLFLFCKLQQQYQ